MATALMPAFAVICGLLGLAGAAKLRRPGAARDALAVVGISLPAAAIRALGLAELALSVIAAGWPGRVSGALVAIAYGGFCLFVLKLLRTAERPTGCGCFGDAAAGAGATHAILNALAWATALAATLRPPPGVSWIVSRPAHIAVPLAIGTLTAAFAAYLAFTMFPSAWRAYAPARAGR